MKIADIINALVNRGWYLVRIKGNHHHFKHPVISGLVTVPHPKREVPKGTLMNIMKQAQLKKSDLIKH